MPSSDSLGLCVGLGCVLIGGTWLLAGGFSAEAVRPTAPYFVVVPEQVQAADDSASFAIAQTELPDDPAILAPEPAAVQVPAPAGQAGIWSIPAEFADPD